MQVFHSHCSWFGRFECLKVIHGHKRTVRHIFLDGMMFSTTSTDETIAVWRIVSKGNRKFKRVDRLCKLRGVNEPNSSTSRHIVRDWNCRCCVAQAIDALLTSLGSDRPTWFQGELMGAYLRGTSKLKKHCVKSRHVTLTNQCTSLASSEFHRGWC